MLGLCHELLSKKHNEMSTDMVKQSRNLNVSSSSDDHDSSSSDSTTSASLASVSSPPILDNTKYPGSFQHGAYHQYNNTQQQYFCYPNNPFQINQSQGGYNSPYYSRTEMTMPGGQSTSAVPVEPIIASSLINRESSALPIKKRRPVPAEIKDMNYWEKRKKNNESARRSREMKKSKEDQMARALTQLQSENLQLRAELTYLRSETEMLRARLFSNNGGFNTDPTGYSQQQPPAIQQSLR